MGILVESNQVACRRPAAIYLGQPPALAARANDSGEPWSLGLERPAPPALLQKEGNDTTAGDAAAYGRVGRVRALCRGTGAQGAGSKDTYPAASRQPANCQPANPPIDPHTVPPSYGYCRCVPSMCYVIFTLLHA